MEAIIRYEDDVDDIVERLERQLRGEQSGDTVVANIDIEITELGISQGDSVTVDGDEAVIEEILSRDEVEVWLTDKEDFKTVNIDTLS